MIRALILRELVQATVEGRPARRPQGCPRLYWARVMRSRRVADHRQQQRRQRAPWVRR